VLGIVCAQVNQLGGRGIAPNLQLVRVVSYSGVLNAVPDAIEAAINVLPPGGVLLLEVQKNYRPTELLEADFALIRKAVANGITVVEAAGNGGYDLDNSPNSKGAFVLNPADPDFQDSGAILVGAATSQVPHERMSFSNYGARVDCYGWGENVDTADSTISLPFRTDMYRADFNGTSSAAPMVAGAALAVQGMASVSLGRRLTAWEMRDLLRAHGTPPASAAKPIGVMPDLRAIIDSGALGTVPLANQQR
jgi:subtilisin family serine protease